MEKRKCPNCYKVVAKTSLFCNHCGYEMSNNGILYHYTSMDTLHAIITNCKSDSEKTINKLKEIAEKDGNQMNDSLENYTIKLRATHWRYLNDPLENEYFFKKLQEFVREDSKLKKYADSFDVSVLTAQWLIGAPYVISLSSKQDNLDMWRSYSKDGAGIAIGFDKDKLSTALTRLGKEEHWGKYTQYSCRYLNDSDIRKVFRGSKDYLLKQFKAGIQVQNLSTLVSSFIMMKHPCYIHEAESRIVLYDSTPRSTRTKYRISKGVIIPYIEITLPIDTIKEIVIGPCSNKAANIQSIKMQLAGISPLVAKYNIDIIPSSIPYRQV